MIWLLFWSMWFAFGLGWTWCDVKRMALNGTHFHWGALLYSLVVVGVVMGPLNTGVVVRLEPDGGYEITFFGRRVK